MKNSRFKKIFITIFLSLVLIFSSFVSVFSTVIPAADVSTLLTSQGLVRYNQAISYMTTNYDYTCAYYKDGFVNIVGVNNSDSWLVPFHLYNNNGTLMLSNTADYDFKFSCAADAIYYTSTYTGSMTFGFYPSGASNSTSFNESFKILYANFPIYDTNYTSPSSPGTVSLSYDNPIKSVSIRPMQRILFNYTSANASSFLKSISATPDKSITLTQGYLNSSGEVYDLTIKKDTTNLLIGPHALVLSDFPIPRSLSAGEYLSYTQANGGNWVWTDLLSDGGGPVATDSNSLVTFTFDTTKCSYSIVSANTGLVIDAGGVTTSAVTTSGIYDNNDNPWGPGDITDDYLVDRADYTDDLLGSIQFGFDNIFKFLKMPFEILYKFIVTLSEIVTYAVGAVGGLMGALTGVYGVLPSTLSYLFVFAISIQVFKLIFGR